VGSIADLISYRRRQERLVDRTLEQAFTSPHGGEFTMMLYTSSLTYAEHVVLVKGDITADAPTLVRMHALDVLQDTLLDMNNPKSGELQAASYASSWRSR